MKKLLLILFILGISACVSQPTATPQTSAQKVAYSYGLYTMAVNTVADMVQSGSISRTEGERLQRKLLTLRGSLDMARVAVRNGKILPRTTLEMLQTSQRILLEIQTDLISKQRAASGGS